MNTRTPPTGIPQDIWNATSAAFDYQLKEGCSISEAVARAILKERAAERERCAAKADHYTTAKHVRRCRELTSEQVYEIKIFARLIAHDIRKGGA